MSAVASCFLSKNTQRVIPQGALAAASVRITEVDPTGTRPKLPPKNGANADSDGRLCCDMTVTDRTLNVDPPGPLRSSGLTQTTHVPAGPLIGQSVSPAPRSVREHALAS